MSNTQNVVEAVRWKKIGRRWMVTLCAMLIINGVLVTLAVCDYGGRAASGQASAATTDAGEPVETTEAAVATEQSSTTGEATASASTETPATTAETAMAVNDVTPLTEPVQPTADPAPIVTTTDDASPATAANAIEEQLVGAVVIINPPTTGGIVHCLVNDTTVSLLPGECRRLPSNGEQRVVFHRGDELEDAELPLGEGVFAFSVSEMGWELTPASGEARRQLLRACRVVE